MDKLDELIVSLNQRFMCNKSAIINIDMRHGTYSAIRDFEDTRSTSGRVFVIRDEFIIFNPFLIDRMECDYG